MSLTLWICQTMLKIADGPYHFSMDYSLLDKPKSEIFGITVGIFKRMKLCQTLGITTSEFLDFLIDIERGYHDNPYHSFYHAVDVTMMLYHMLEQYNMSEHLSSMDSTLLMIAALGHDIGHVSQFFFSRNMTQLYNSTIDIIARKK